MFYMLPLEMALIQTAHSTKSIIMYLLISYIRDQNFRLGFSIFYNF